MFAKSNNIKDDSSDYHIYYPCPLSVMPPVQSHEIPSDGCVCVSIDPAVATFAFRIERRYANSYVETIYMHKLDFKNYDNVTKTGGTTQIDPRILTNVTQFLESMLPYMQEARIVALERQMAINYKATRIFQHTLTYFMLKAPTFTYPCIVMDISAKLKGRMLNAPKNLNYNGLKEWGIDKALELLKIRGDTFALETLKYHRGKTKTKADDLADTVIQMEAWFILVNGVHTVPTEGPVLLLS